MPIPGMAVPSICLDDTRARLARRRRTAVGLVRPRHPSQAASAMLRSLIPATTRVTD